MAKIPAKSISFGESLIASVSRKAISLWRTKPLSSHPVAVLSAPESQAIVSAALSPCGSVLAVLLGDEGLSEPVLLLCDPQSAAPLLRLELPFAAEKANTTLLWVTGDITHSLLVPLEEGHFILFKFCAGYRRLAYKQCFDFICDFGPAKRIHVVNCGKVDQALVLTYASAIAVYSLPNGEPLILKHDVHVQAVMKIIRTPEGYAALALIDNYAARITKGSEQKVRLQHSYHPRRAKVQCMVPGLVWAVIGNKGCKALAPLSGFSSEKVLTYSISTSEKCRLVLLTDAGRLVFLDPFHGGGPLFEHCLPRACVPSLESAMMVTAYSALRPLDTHVIVSHHVECHKLPSTLHYRCMHVIGINPDGHCDSNIEWGFQIDRKSHIASPLESGTVSPSLTRPSTAATNISNLLSIPLKLPLKPRPIGVKKESIPCGCAAADASHSHNQGPTVHKNVEAYHAQTEHARTNSIQSISLRLRRKPPKSVENVSKRGIRESIPLRLPRRPPEPLINITNLGVRPGISRLSRRRQKIRAVEKLLESAKIPLRLRICSLRSNSK